MRGLTTTTIRRGSSTNLEIRKLRYFENGIARAHNDSIDALTLQGVDISGIVTCLPGEGKDNPVMRCLDNTVLRNSPVCVPQKDLDMQPLP